MKPGRRGALQGLDITCCVRPLGTAASSEGHRETASLGSPGRCQGRHGARMGSSQCEHVVMCRISTDTLGLFVPHIYASLCICFEIESIAFLHRLPQACAQLCTAPRDTTSKAKRIGVCIASRVNHTITAIIVINSVAITVCCLR